MHNIIHLSLFFFLTERHCGAKLEVIERRRCVAALNSSLNCRSALSALAVSDSKCRRGKRLSIPFFLAPSCVGVMVLATASSHSPTLSHSPGLIKGSGREEEHQAKREAARSASPWSTQMDAGETK